MIVKRVPIDTYCEKKVPTLQKTYDGLIDYLDISSVDNAEKRIISYQTIRSSNAPSRAKQLLKKGDVLVSTVRPNLNAVAVVEEETENLMVGSTGYCVLRCKENIDVRYLFNFCQSQYFIDDMSSQATGASYPAVSNSIVRNSLIPCHSIEEQRKIAEKIDTVSELIAFRKQQLVELDELVKSRFIELFGDRYTNDKKWDNKPLYECADFCNGKAHEQVVDENGEYILVTSRCIASDISDYRRTNALLFPLQVNDIAMVMSDVPNGRALAKCVLIDEDGKYTLNQRICCLRNYSFNPIFFYYLLNRHEYFLSFNDGNAQTNLRKDDLLACNIIIPPMEVQEQFATFVEQTDKSKVAVQQSLEKLETLKKALMQKYFG